MAVSSYLSPRAESLGGDKAVKRTFPDFAQSGKNLHSFLMCLTLSCVMISCSSQKEKRDPYAKMQAEAMNLIAQPMFSGDYIFYKVTSAKANLERYYVDTKQLYFTCNKQDYNDANLNKFVINKDSITVGKEENGVLVLGTMRYNDPEKVFFKMPLSNFKVDSTKLIETPYKSVTYKITLPQILDFTYLRSAIGGGAIVLTNENTRFMNHGSVVAKVNEPSLADFVKQLTKDETTKELKAQKLLDFVTSEIEYNKDEAERGYETIKRPDEVLFTKNSDCSGKAILYASLLQQIDIKWSMLYFKGHVCVGVAGNFNVPHALKFKLKGLEYYIAEITDPTAIIGVDSWNGEKNETNLLYYQVSETGSDVYDYKTHNKLDFVRAQKQED